MSSPTKDPVKQSWNPLSMAKTSFWWFSSVGDTWSKEEEKAAIRLLLIFLFVAIGTLGLADKFVFKSAGSASVWIFVIEIALTIPFALYLSTCMARFLWPELMTMADANNAAMRKSRAARNSDGFR
jgi:hypothetical protein